MDTVIIKGSELVNVEVVHQLQTWLTQGELVIFPTETVYGIGGFAELADAARLIYATKGRPSDNPLIVHLADYRQIAEYAYIDYPAVEQLAKAFWPGPLTMVLRKKDSIPMSVTGGLSTVAIRIPSHPVARLLLEGSGLPLAAPSANLSGKPSSTKFAHVMEDFNGKVKAIIDGGDVPIGIESTVVDMTGPVPTILRPGSITQAMIQHVLNQEVLDQSETKVGETPKSPGMKYKHYAPQASLTLITGQPLAITTFLQDAVKKNPQLAIIGPTETLNELTHAVTIDLGSITDLDTIGKNLFAAFRELDERHINQAYIIALSDEGLGKAIMNRVMKAVNYQVIDVDQR